MLLYCCALPLCCHRCLSCCCCHRRKLRKKQRIGGSSAGDCVIHCFCHECGLCQEYGHVEFGANEGSKAGRLAKTMAGVTDGLPEKP